MIFKDLLLVELWFACFCILSIKEFRLIKIPSKLKLIGDNISRRHLVLSIFVFIFLVFVSIVTSKSAINVIFKTVLGYSVLIHGIVLSGNKNLKKGWVALPIVLIIIAMRVLTPSVFSHNLFIIFSVSWLSVVLIKKKIITPRRFLIISIAWFIYDFTYVWLTPVSEVVNSSTKSVGFPLGIVSGDSLLGAADLFWAGMFLSVIKKDRILISGLLIAVDLILGVYMLNNQNTAILPLLVFWVPVSWLYFGTKKLLFLRS